jgi:membrane protein YdbS with pleckstrin-like domain
MFHILEGEQIRILVRKHWFILFADIVGLLFLFALPYAFYLFAVGRTLSLPNETWSMTVILDPTLLLFIGSAWALIFWVKLFGVWTNYYLDVWVVTDRRVIDIEQKGLFHRQTSIFRMERIQDVTVEIHGLIATLFNFGDVHVQTAGVAQAFIIRGVANPKHVRESILAEQDRIIEQQVQAAAPAL